MHLKSILRVIFTKQMYRIFRIIFSSILVKPSERPQVFGFKPRYRVGDTLSMTCYVNNTFPAANLTWFVNGKRVITTLKFNSFRHRINCDDYFDMKNTNILTLFFRSMKIQL